MGFYERFIDLCNKAGVYPATVAHSIGLSNSSTTYWKRGSIPKSDTLQKLADYFGVSIGYLLGTELEGSVQQQISSDILDDVSVAFYGEYQELSEDDKETIRDMVRLMRARRKAQKEKIPPQD